VAAACASIVACLFFFLDSRQTPVVAHELVVRNDKPVQAATQKEPVKKNPDQAAQTAPKKEPAKKKEKIRPDVLVTLQTPSCLQGCLAKVYAEPKFKLWTARMAFLNRGTVAVHDYRVRFQVVGFSPDWTEWQSHATVAPGQTVETLGYPILDVDKVAKLEESRMVFVKAQYQYRTADDQLIERTKTVRVELLGHNLVEYSSMPLKEGISFQQMNDLSPYILATFTTYQDKAIQQLAGRICRQTGGNAAALDLRYALAYMKLLYDFMGTHIAYQTPPGSINDRLRQHMKFPRDVLQNHAGTCIDLAIFYASACESVGLQPLLVLIPRHCFVAVRLGNQIYALEATAIMKKATFEQACQIGKNEWTSMKEDQRAIIDIAQMRKLKVSPLDLPAVGEGWLDKVCPENKAQQTEPKPAKTTSPLVGTWRTSVNTTKGIATFTMTLTAEGTFTCLVVDQAGNKGQTSGTYRFANGILYLTLSNGQIIQGTLRWTDGTGNSFDLTGTNGSARYVRVA
jgi:hypothetical protein